MIVFPVICPACASDAGRRVIPESPEVETFQCGRCHHQWSEPAPPPSLELRQRRVRLSRFLLSRRGEEPD
jgi:hypothetical protein